MSNVLLGDVAHERKETCKGNKEGYPIVGLEHLIPEEITLTTWDEGAENTFTKMFRKGDVLFGRRRAYLKKAAIAPFDGICSGDITVIEADPDKILPELLPFIIQNDDFFDFAVGKSAGSLSPRVKWEHLKNYAFELHDMDKQKELAELLWAIDDTKKSYQKLITATDELVKSQFIELSQGVPLKKIANICSSYGRGKSPKYVNNSSVRVINQACIYWDGIHLENVKYQDEECFKNENRLLEGAVLLNATGTGTLGRSYVFEEIEGTYMADSHVSVFYTKADIMIPRFLQVFFSLPTTQKAIYDDCVNGSTNQIELSKEKVGKVEVPVPNIDIQRSYIQFVRQSDKSKLLLQNKYEKINQDRRLLTCLMKTTQLSR